MDQNGNDKRNDAVTGLPVGQAALRRLLGGSPISSPDRLLTSEIIGERTRKSGSVSARRDFLAQNVLFQNSTEADFRSPLQSTAGREGNHSGVDLEQTEEAWIKEAEAVSRTMGGEDMARFQTAGFDTRPYLEQAQTDALATSTYLPGDFRYLPSSYSTIKGNRAENSRIGKTTRSLSAHSPASDWARIRQGYGVDFPDLAEATLAKGNSLTQDDFEAQDNVGDFHGERAHLIRHAGILVTQILRCCLGDKRVIVGERITLCTRGNLLNSRVDSNTSRAVFHRRALFLNVSDPGENPSQLLTT
jgi:hypothetical protein